MSQSGENEEMKVVMVVPACMWSDFLDVATDRGLVFCFSEEENGSHVYGDCAGELEDILWGGQVVDGLDLVFQRAEVETSVAGLWT